MRGTTETMTRELVVSYRRLFKADRPRAIDCYIDYFGGAAGDPCGENLLDCFEDPDPPARVAANR
jgi:hypothetical protein